MATDLPVFHKHKYNLYNYYPSLAAAIIFAVVFALLTALLSFRLAKNKLWFFVPFAIGGVLELVGYVGRAVNAQETAPNWELGPYIIQTLCLLVSPAFFAASIYMTLGRLIRSVHGDSVSPMPLKWMTKAFVIGDVISFLAQVTGGGLQATSSRTLAKSIVLGGLGLQIAYFGLFVVLAAIFHFRFQKLSISVRQQELITTPWKKHMYILYLSSVLIFVRSVFRTVEYGQGFHGYIISHEVFLYVFDACLMATVVGVYAVFLPVELKGVKLNTKKTAGMFPLEEGVKEAKTEART